MMATMSDAHREWHLNSGVPMGLPGCPQDACHTEYLSRSEVKRLTRQRDINFAHMRGEQGSATISCAHCHGIHFAVSYVRECAGVNTPVPQQVPNHVPMDWSVPPVPREEFRQAVEIPTGVWHSTGPTAAEGHREVDCPGESCPVWSLPALSVQTAVERMRANLAAKEDEAAEAKRARYAAWRSIPVFARSKAYYALEMDGVVHFFRVSRPAKGPHKGKTFVEEQASDNFYKMGWVRTGEVLDAIAADPEAAGVLYGQNIGRCFRCHRTLTDAESRAAGLGPDCAKKG